MPLQRQTSKQQDSFLVINQFLVKAGELYGKEITPALVKIWNEEFGKYPVFMLQTMFSGVLKRCKFFPTPADVFDMKEKVEKATSTLTAEQKWQQVLEYCRKFIRPDLAPDPTAPRIGERTMTAIRAAGGLIRIEGCSEDDLVWAKKAFIETYAAWEILQKDQYLIPDGELKEAIAGVAKMRELKP